ncbi:MAG: PD-(D/E)XK nuclease family protein [Pseudomonadota bacterium]
MNDWLDQLIAVDAAVLTANHRLAASLVDAVTARHLHVGRSAWRPLVIREWRGMLSALYQSVAAEDALPARLTPQQSLLLWEDALRPDLDEASDNLPALARLARDTRDALLDHGVHADDVAESASTDDQWVFSQALRRYLARLENNGWTDDAGLRRFVVDNAARFDWPEQVAFAGFIHPSPLLTELQDVLRQQGCTLPAPPDEVPGKAVLAKFQSSLSELRAAGLWARQQREQGRRVAIVVAGLESRSQQVASLLREGFTPGWQYDRPGAGASVNVSFGRHLSDYPMIAGALLALRWAIRPGNSASVSTLLRSGLTGEHNDSSRFLAARALHDVPDREWTPVMLRTWCSPTPATSLAAFTDGFEKLAESLSGGSRPIKAWAKQFEAGLESLGWPGKEALDSAEFQLLNRWNELLEDYSSLARVSGPISASKAISRLTALAAETVFQPEQLDTAVDVLGPMEAVGQRYDALWITGLTDADWPGTARPSPLLSLTLQRKAGMRDSSPEQRLQQQRALLKRLVSAAADTVLSYPTLDGNAEMAPSPLLAAFEPKRASFEDPGWFIDSLRDDVPLQAIDETPPPALPGERIYGGSSIPDLQHGSPFDAFVVARLAINDPEPFSRAIGARIRGILTHDALSKVYTDIPDQAALLTLDAPACESLIASNIESASRGWFIGVDATLRRLLKLEEQRLQGVISDVLEFDRQREPFAVIGLEAPATLRHGAVDLSLKIDRIDRFESGELLLLDYKTGRAEGFVRRDGGPRSFQLVVYSMCFDEPVAGLGLFFATAKETVIRGIGQDLDKDDRFDDTLRAWRGEVRHLLDDFAQGDVRIVAQRPLSDGMDSLLVSRLPELKRYV